MTESGRRFSLRVARRGLPGLGSGYTASGKRYSVRVESRNGKTSSSPSCPFLFSSILLPRRRRRRRQLQLSTVTVAVSHQPQDVAAECAATADTLGFDRDLTELESIELTDDTVVFDGDLTESDAYFSSVASIRAEYD